VQKFLKLYDWLSSQDLQASLSLVGIFRSF
jgi:hypothetical protein